MRKNIVSQRHARFSGLTSLLACAFIYAPLVSAAPPGTVDLLATPPEITATVAPNVALTFDDSGSMAWAYMPDKRPFDNGGWGLSTSISTNADNPWFCAGRMDSSATSPSDPRSKPMNGMYYDPNVTYRPPLKADGITEFPAANFFAAWNNGIQHNRPLDPIASTTRNLNTSPFCRTAQPLADAAYYQLEGNDFIQDWGDTGLITTTNVWTSAPHLDGYQGSITGSTINVDPRTLTNFEVTTRIVKPNQVNPNAPTIPTEGIYEFESGYLINGNPVIALQPGTGTDAPYLRLLLNTVRCTNVKINYTLRDLSTTSTAVQQLALQARVGTSGSWTNIKYYANLNTNTDTADSALLGSSFSGEERVQVRWITTNTTASGASKSNPIGIDDILVTGNCTPTLVDDNAGYYRLKDSVTLTQDTYGRITTSAATIYDKNNWEWVPLPLTQRQNFANWYSYYRTRTNSASTAMSRAFAPFNENIRMVWQNLGNNAATAGINAPILVRQSTPMYKFADAPVNSNVRTRFYDWLFQIPASGGTPNISASNRVGSYFTGAGGAVDSNPYWDRDLNRELSCRQNFHINMSDGFWNDGNPHPAPAGSRTYLPSGTTLPDGRAYSTGDTESSIFHRFSGTAISPSMADVMFHFWATDLRPDFAANDATRLKVPPFLPDRSTSLFGTPVAPGQDPRTNKEVYWNPANDPASWPHLVNFNISFGLEGTLPDTPESYESLRKGDNASLIWPYPAVGTDDGRKLDDFWHAALVSRGRFLSAKNPEELISSLQEIIASIVARRGASTAVSVSLPIITDGTTGYTAGYDTTDWSGFVTRNRLDPNTAERIGVLWDAGCILTGGACSTTAQTGMPVTDPNSRRIFTSDGTPASGKPFRWTDLNATQRARLNVNPNTIRTDLGPYPGTFTADPYGSQRLEYVRGNRTNETTVTPRFRTRSSVLGSVIRGQPIYVSSPTSGYPDTFPTGSPEDLARIAGQGYRVYQNTWRERSPTIYVAANDGMLHAFDGANGNERFAYVPNAVIENFRLTKSTQIESGLTPSVDDKPLVTDVFINGAWRTVLLGSLRLGGRGVYLLDITNPPTSSATSESSLASTIPMWEFTNVPPPGSTAADCSVGARHCSSLGYTYESVNIARLKYQNKWVALVSSGYFPKEPLDPASNSPAANRTSLLVIDLETGTLIREIKTATAPQTAAQSFALSQAIVMDLGTDFIDDVAIAGDLAGNLWRFDLSSTTPASWKVDLMFKAYGAGGALAVGDQPIASAPVVMANAERRAPVVVFGTGKFIGLDDRTSAIPEQSFYGINDYGTCDAGNPIACSAYPVVPNQLIVQKITQNTDAVRKVVASTEPVPASPKGWRIRLNLAAEPGERSFDSGFPFYTSNQVLLRTIIPKGVDPCDPGARYGLMVVNAANGSAQVDPADPSPTYIVGGVVASSTPPGEPITLRGGGNVVIAGLTEREGGGGVVNQAVVDAITQSLSRADDIWHRGAWREILDN